MPAAFGRSLHNFGVLYPGEEALFKAAKTGNDCPLGEQVPDNCSQDNFVRASFVRFLALGGDSNHPVHEKGIQLKGAWIGSDAGDARAISISPTAMMCSRFP